MVERTESHRVGVLLTVPVTVLIAAFSWMSIFLQWAFLVHTGAQYLATLYTKDSVEVLRVPALHPQIFLASFDMMLFLDFIYFFYVVSKCCLKVSVLPNSIPRYLGHSSFTILTSLIFSLSSLFAIWLFRWKATVVVLLVFKLRCQFFK
jgi:hypothetical protein